MSRKHVVGSRGWVTWAALACAISVSAEESVLRRGDRGPKVRRVQAFLDQGGYRVAINGIYEDATATAVRAFQRSHCLPPTGRVDSLTRRALERQARLQRGPAPADLIRRARLILEENPAGFRSDVFVVVDLRKKSSEKRLFVVEARSGRVRSYLTTHGEGSDPGNTGRAVRFANVQDSHATSTGTYRTAETYSGKHGYSLRLDGLSASNTRARARYLVVRGGTNVSEEAGRAGLSLGGFALDPRVRTAVIDRIKGGALLYVPHPSGAESTEVNSERLTATLSTRSPSQSGTGRVQYRGNTVSSASARAALERIARHTGRTVRVTSGDRDHVPRGGSHTSLHLRGRAVDFSVVGLSLGQTFELIRANRSAILGSGAYEVIWHQAQTNTGGPHLHLGEFSGRRSTVFKVENRGRYRRVP